LIPKIYDGARSIRLLKEDKSHREVKINQPFKDDDGEEKEFDMTVGTYDVMVTTGPSFTTKRQEAAESMIQMMGTQLGAVIAQAAPDMIVASMDWPGAQELAGRLKKILPPGLADDAKDGEIPPQVQMQMQQMQQLIQQGAQEIEQLQQELQSKEAENQAKMADVQTKQGDLQLKAQQMQLSAEESARKSELDMMRMQLDQQKLGLDAEKLELDKMKLQLDAVKIQMGAETSNNTASKTSNSPQIDTSNPEMLKAQIATLENMQLMEQEQAEIEQQNREAEIMIDAQRLQEETAARQAMMDGIIGIQQTVMALTQAVNAPKVVQRDPNTGLISGVMNG
jgi:Phage P22-like portal protein